MLSKETENQNKLTNMKSNKNQHMNLYFSLYCGMKFYPVGEQTNLFITWIRWTSVFRNMRLLWKMWSLLLSCFCTALSCSCLILAMCLSFLQHQYHIWLNFPFSRNGSLSHLSVQMFNIGFCTWGRIWNDDLCKVLTAPSVGIKFHCLSVVLNAPDGTARFSFVLLFYLSVFFTFFSFFS